MQNWTIEPRDPLVIRDGRPLAHGMPNMRSLDFPWPSTLAGMVRSHAGLDATGRFTLTPDEARKIAILGPWLAEVGADGGPSQRLVTAPRDLVPFDAAEPESRKLHLRRLVPRTRGTGQSDLPERLEVVGFAGEPPAGKPSKRMPSFWSWNTLERWLGAPEQVAGNDVEPEVLGTPGLEHERRVHVAIDPGTQTAREGRLFSTDGLRFVQKNDPRGRMQQFAIEFATAEKLRNGPVVLGGERRLSFLRRSGPWSPSRPDALRNLSGRARVLLLTPCFFGSGAVPASIAGARVVAAVTPRAEIVNGFDFAWRSKDGRKRGGPKPTRRAVPAGSVYWVDLAGVDVQPWIEKVWWRSVAEDEQDRRDGFGLAVVGVS